MSDAWLHTDPILPHALSYALLICLTSLFIWMEWRRNAPYLTIRLASVVLMMAGFAGYLLCFQLKTQQSEKIILLTPGYSNSTVDSIVKRYPAMEVLYMEGAEPYRNAGRVTSWHDVVYKEGSIAFITGEGLPHAAFDMFGAFNYQYLPSPYPQGIIRFSPPDDAVANRPTKVEGIFNNPGPNRKLYLVGPGGREDSITLSGTGFQHFMLSFLPKTSGNFLYSIESEGTEERFPVTVKKHDPLDILFIHHYPTFETRHLKELLGRTNRLLLRYQLSKNRYRYEFINRESRPVNRVTEALLSDFDLLVIDSDALRSLSAPELNSIQRAVESGLGLLPIFNASPERLPDIIPFSFSNYRNDTAHFRVSGSDDTILPALRATVSNKDGMQPVLANRNRTLSGYRHSGLGKVGFQLLQNTYQLVLSGDSLVFSAIWSPLLEKISRPRQRDLFLRTKDRFPLFPESPINFEVVSREEPVLFAGSERLPVAEHAMIDGLWHGKIWTGKKGWFTITTQKDTAIQLYISAPGEWRSLRAAQAIGRTLQRSVSSQQQSTAIAFRPVPVWIFYLAFLFGAGFLWVAPKL